MHKTCCEGTQIRMIDIYGDRNSILFDIISDVQLLSAQPSIKI